MTPRDLRAQLVGLAALEGALWLMLRALDKTYPAAARAAHVCEDPDVATARQLFDFAEDVLVALDEHRARVSDHLNGLLHPNQVPWPF